MIFVKKYLFAFDIRKAVDVYDSGLARLAYASTAWGLVEYLATAGRTTGVAELHGAGHMHRLAASRT